MPIQFAANLRFLRTRSKLDIATMATHFGISDIQWNAYEQGRDEAPYPVLIELADFFQLSIDKLLRSPIANNFGQLRDKELVLILLDVDGTMTDGGMYYGESGDVFKRFDAQDGLAIHRMITRHNMNFGFISAGATTNIVQKRAKKLGIKRVYCGTRPKIQVAEEWLDEMNLNFEQVAYLGDDLNDLPIINRAGISACPANARPQIQMASDVVLNRKGGHGCVREFIEDVMAYDILE